MKLLKYCPLLFATAVVSIILSCLTFALKDELYGDYAEGYDSAKMPFFSVMMKGMADGVFPWDGVADIRAIDEKFLAGRQSEETTETPTQETVTAKETEEPQPVQETEPEETDISGNDVSGNSDISGNDISGNSEEEEGYEFCEVTDDYFEDAVFIGDSRTVGLSEYVEALDTKATFYSKVSLTIYTVLDKPFLKMEGKKGKITVDEALSENQFGKVYIMLGLNEMGTGNINTFITKYSEVIARIRELQPDAIIYIQGIMHVTADKSDNDKLFNNPNINERNEALSQLANDEDIFYIDMNESVDDEDGNLITEISFDGVHLKASAYERWHQYLLQHAIVKE
ncbi:acylhydrolase [Butyrivibrio sp. X503]|uniref:GDSL-type esterase/lipase family protein n=1 Tax=Butyrivibrio sp. X503 TaxID=2364878 RepID=UPI000EA98850|nr:GDSL-type esterase/lipase family protein [Butyrivibrio sp. X503]RKM58001.1 acylhydrolase [Butyrivibrio sp. X503]